MSGGVEDTAEREHEKAIQFAKDNYPGIEIVERCWTGEVSPDVYSIIGCLWEKEKTDMYNILLRQVIDGKILEQCPVCGGSGKEEVVYIHEKWIVHEAILVKWDCRNCIGIGFVAKEN